MGGVSVHLRYNFIGAAYGWWGFVAACHIKHLTLGSICLRLDYPIGHCSVRDDSLSATDYNRVGQIVSRLSAEVVDTDRTIVTDVQLWGGLYLVLQGLQVLVSHCSRFETI